MIAVVNNPCSLCMEFDCPAQKNAFSRFLIRSYLATYFRNACVVTRGYVDDADEMWGFSEPC